MGSAAAAAAELAATFGDCPLFWARAKVFVGDLLTARGFESIAGALTPPRPPAARAAAHGVGSLLTCAPRVCCSATGSVCYLGQPLQWVAVMGVVVKLTLTHQRCSFIGPLPLRHSAYCHPGTALTPSGCGAVDDGTGLLGCILWRDGWEGGAVADPNRPPDAAAGAAGGGLQRWVKRSRAEGGMGDAPAAEWPGFGLGQLVAAAGAVGWYNDELQVPPISLEPLQRLPHLLETCCGSSHSVLSTCISAAAAG